MNMLPVVILILVSFSLVTSFDLTVLHTNDIHSRFEQFNTYGSRCTESAAEKNECFGGMARLMTKIDEIRRNYSNVILGSAGDFYQGTYMYSVHKWRIVVDFANRLGYDFTSFGNHEFDDGIDGVIPFLDNAKFPFVACNLDITQEPSLEGKFFPSVILNVRGTEIGIVGYITPDTKSISQPGDVIFTDEIECLKKEVQSLKEKGIKIIIAVGHSGYPKDLEIAQEVEGIDIVIGGHTDTFLYTGKPPSIEEPVNKYPVVVTHDDGSKTLVVQDYTFGKYLGFLHVHFTEDGKVKSWQGNPILLDSTVEEDPVILEALVPYVTEVNSKAREIVGTTKVLLHGDKNTCRMKECNMGNMLADSAVNYFLDMPTDYGWASVSIAVWTSGGIRASINELNGGGNITLEDVMSVAPFGNVFHIVELYGGDLIAMMEEAVFDYDTTGYDPSGGLLQVSGLKVWYDVNKAPGNRVKKLLVRCANCRVPNYLPVDYTSTYKVAVPHYNFKGGNGFKVFQRSVSVENTGVLDSDMIRAYLANNSPIITGVEGRLNIE